MLGLDIICCVFVSKLIFAQYDMVPSQNDESQTGNYPDIIIMLNPN